LLAKGDSHHQRFSPKNALAVAVDAAATDSTVSPRAAAIARATYGSQCGSLRRVFGAGLMSRGNR
jgi:hypothetical protein